MRATQLATDILASAFNPKFYPKGYRIRSSIIAFSFCHANSFVPIYAPSEFSFKSQGGQQLAYWDDKAFVTSFVPLSHRPVPVIKAVASKEDEDIDAFFSSIEAALPVEQLDAMSEKSLQATSEPVQSIPAPSIVVSSKVNLIGKISMAPGAIASGSIASTKHTNDDASKETSKSSKKAKKSATESTIVLLEGALDCLFRGIWF